MPDSLNIYEFTWGDRVDAGHVIVVASSEEEARENLLMNRDFRNFTLVEIHELASLVYVVTEECDD